jgi:hypothetical protein
LKSLLIATIHLLRKSNNPNLAPAKPIRLAQAEAQKKRDLARATIGRSCQALVLLSSHDQQLLHERSSSVPFVMKYQTQHEEYAESQRLPTLLDAQGYRLSREFLRAHGLKWRRQITWLAHDLDTQRHRHKVRPE